MGHSWRLGGCTVRLSIEGWTLERPLRASSANLQAVGRADATELEPGRTGADVTSSEP